MSKISPKKLHVGKSMNDLKYDLPSDIHNYNIHKLCRSAKTLHSNARVQLNERDEEMAYIYFMKYLNVIEQMQRRPEFAMEREYVNKMIGRANIEKAFDNIKMLKDSLSARYSILNKMSNNTESIVFNESDESIEEIDSDKTETTTTTGYLDTTFLFDMMQRPEISLLIIDCRPMTDFKNTKIKYKSICNVPEEMIQTGMTAGKICSLLTEEMQGQWSARLIKDNVVLIDWCSSSNMVNLNSPIQLLQNILVHWDQDYNGKRPIYILDGGFEEFSLRYPAYTTNPTYARPMQLNAKANVLSDIEYPSIQDISMKDQPNKRPIIDRSSKETALKALQEKETLAENLIENSKSILQTESKLSQMQTGAINAEQSDREAELMYEILEMRNKKTDFELRIAEIEKSLALIRNQSTIPGGIGSSSGIGIVADGKQISPEIALRLEREAEDRISRKEAEQKLLNEKLSRIDKEREKKLFESRKHPKPSANNQIPIEKIPQSPPTPIPPSSSSSSSSTPPTTTTTTTIPTPTTKKIQQHPTFDRLSKPSFNNVAAVTYTYRDFSPERGSKGKGLTGLKNLGNTCYMNSIMQCLSNTELLADYLITGNYKINRSNSTKGKIVEEVSAVIKEIWCAQYKYISSKNFRNMVGEFHQMFRGMDQQDSHEFLTILMDWLHSDLQFLIRTDIPKGRLSAADKAWQEFIQSKESYILKLFYGQIKSTVKCVLCGSESATYESFSNLSLELPSNKNRCDITDCLNSYFDGERIRGWNCPTCNEKRDAIKKLNISKLPPILVIHLKRFYADNDSMNNVFKKKQTYVDFPLNGFNVRDYVAPSELPNISSKNLLYNLYSVSNHYGVLERGHCTAFCKSRIFNRWFKFDDHRVSELDETDVVSSAAYILFYTTHESNHYKINKL